MYFFRILREAGRGLGFPPFRGAEGPNNNSQTDFSLQARSRNQTFASSSFRRDGRVTVQPPPGVCNSLTNRPDSDFGPRRERIIVNTTKDIGIRIKVAASAVSAASGPEECKRDTEYS